MTAMVGKRLFLGLTGADFPEVFPVNKGRPLRGPYYTVLGEVTEEHAGGVWFRLEKIFDDRHKEMKINPPTVDQYFLPWGALRRATLAEGNEARQTPQIGFRPVADR